MAVPEMKRDYTHGNAYDSLYNRRIKRFIDFIIAVPLFILVLPIYIIIGIMIVIDDGFPVFYCPLRGGYSVH